MPITPEVDATRVPRRLIANHPKGESSASGLVVPKSRLHPPRFGGAGASPRTDWIGDLFLATSKEGRSSIYAPEGSVILGRSITSWNRGGWLELQERLPEEIAVAAIWLAGVDKLRDAFEWGKKKFWPGYNHISTNTAWDNTWAKTTHVDLSPQEMFTKNSQEIGTLLRLKSLRWVLSVGSALALVAYVIPVANQKKTDWILNRLNRRKRQTEGSNVQFGDPGQNQPALLSGSRQAPQGRTSLPGLTPQSRIQSAGLSGHTIANTPFGLPFTAAAPITMGNTTTYATSPLCPAFPSPPLYSPYRTFSQPHFQGGNQAHNVAKSPQSGGSVKFGGLGSLVQGLGHAVEQTPYGSILVVDAGIWAGRGATANQRSPYETVEVLFRDIGSLYFYILCAPHLMKVSSWLLGDRMVLQPRVAQQLHEAIKTQADGHALTPGRVERILKGATGPLGDTLMSSEGELRKQMRQAPNGPFTDLLRKESQVYLKGQHPELLDTLVQSLQKQGGPIDTKAIHDLWTDITSGREGFAKLKPEQRRDLGTALKQAFRHTVGMPVDIAHPDRTPEFTKLFEVLEQTESDILSDRIRRTTHLDTLSQTHTMLRRSINVMYKTLGGNQLYARADALAAWMDETANRHMTLAERIVQEIDPAAQADRVPFHLPEALQQKLNPLLGKEAVSQLSARKGVSLTEGSKAVAEHIFGRIHETMRALTGQATKNSAESKLLAHYTERIGNLAQEREGRLFSLAVEQHDAGLGSKLREMLKGGLENDSRFRHQALDIVGQLETDSRQFANTAKAERMRGMIANYTDALLQKVNQPASQTALVSTLEQFYNRSRNLHYGAWTLSLSATMACLGWLVPHLQVLLTKRLTGKNTHPGIASAEHAQELLQESKNHPTATASTKPAASSWNMAAYKPTHYGPLPSYYHPQAAPYQHSAETR